MSIDGEAPNGEYSLLAASGNRYIEDTSGLSTEECLDFLLDLPRGASGGTKPIYIWFAMDYDVNMILRDVPLKGENSAEQLKKTNKIYWHGYRITYIRRKILRVSHGKRRHSSVDVWGFFQASFEQALLDWSIEVPEIISEGKSARGTEGFAGWSNKKVREYNNAELVLLSELAERLRDSVSPLNLPIQSWHGPAALAGAWLSKNKVKEWLSNEDSEKLIDIASRAYFGGRIDVKGYGIVSPVYHYDIVSAYPAAIATLPSLRNVKWKRQKEGHPQRGRLYVARIKWRIPATYWAPFPWRSDNGSIRYPLEGEGWYWKSEIEQAIQKYGAENFEFIESYSVEESSLEYPFYNLIHDTFAYRAELKAAGDPSHKAVRLVLNSLYGKFAQTVGSASYHSLIWAGMITAQTRAQLAQGLTEDVVCCMTDSLWSAAPLDLPIGKKLGDWEQQNDSILYLAEAGLYESELPDGSRHVWQRGFDKRNPVDIRTLVNEWLTGDPTYSPSYTVNRFIGMGLATVTSYPWRQWVELERRIEPVPVVGTTKRLPLYPIEQGGSPSTTFQNLPLRGRDTQEISAPYKNLTADEQLIIRRLEDECLDE